MKPNDQKQAEQKDFKLERYKYILSQINNVNANVHKYLTLYQTVASAIIGAGVYLLMNWKNLKTKLIFSTPRQGRIFFMKDH